MGRVVLMVLRPKWLESIGKDKLIHFIIGVFTMTIAGLFTTTAWVLATVLIAVAYGIEISQKVLKWGAFEHLDAWVVILGGLTVAITIYKGSL